MATVTVAATQFACGPEPDANIAAAERLVRRAAAAGARIVLLQELFETPYFCKDQKRFRPRPPGQGHPMLKA
jgi:N-carbamoylputrescine amidase